MRNRFGVRPCGATRPWHDWLRRVAASVLLGSALASPIHSDVGARPSTPTPNAEDPLAAAPDDVAARIQVAQTLVAAARYPEAIDEYRKLIALAPDSGVQEDLARILVLAGRYAEAVTEYRSLVERAPDDRWLRRSLARALTAADRRREAIPLLDALIEEDPGDAETLRERALIARWQGDFATARRLFRQALVVERGARDVEEDTTVDPQAPAEPQAAPAPGRSNRLSPVVTLPLLLGLLGLGIVAGQRRTLGVRVYLLLVSATGLLVAAVFAWLYLAP